MATCTAPQPSFTVPPTTATSVFQELEEAREELEEALSSRQRLEEHLRLRERELTALKGALKEEVANHDRELERVRLQCHSDMEQLRRSVEDISQVRALCLGFVSSHPPFAHHDKVLCLPLYLSVLHPWGSLELSVLPGAGWLPMSLGRLLWGCFGWC